MVQAETFYSSLNWAQKGVWNTVRFGTEFVGPVVTTDLVALGTGKQVVYDMQQAAQFPEPLRSYGEAMFEVAEEVGMDHLIPNIEKPLENLGLALLSLHLIANRISFSSETQNNHPNGFVRTAAKVNNIAKKIGSRTFSAATIFMTPGVIGAVPEAITDLAGNLEHPFVSGAIVAIGVSGALNIAVDALTVAAKTIEVWEARYDHHKEVKQQHAKQTVSKDKYPVIRNLGAKHLNLVRNTAKQVKDHVVIQSETTEILRNNEIARQDPTGTELEARLQAHARQLQHDSHPRRLERVTLEPVTPPTLSDRLTDALSRYADRHPLGKSVAEFLREHIAPNPQAEKPVIIREKKKE